MSVLNEIASRIAKKHGIPIKFIEDLFREERERLTQVRRRNVVVDIRELLNESYWEDADEG